MEITIDTGNKQIKTKHFTFIAGLSHSDAVPTTVAAEDYFKFNGKYYFLTNNRSEYARDKSKSNNYKLLTYLGIVKELDYMARENMLHYVDGMVYNVTLLCGLPPAHMDDPLLKNNFKNYFLMDTPESIMFQGKTWNIKINRVNVYAQCFAAIMTQFSIIKEYPKVLSIDIGGFTTDYMMIKRGKMDMNNTDSLENGVILFYANTKKECRKRNDSFLDESDIDEILIGDKSMYDQADIDVVSECAKNFVDKLLATFRELQIDLKSSYVVFMGGGSLLLKKFLESSEILKNFTFLESINANANGYEYLYKIQKSARK